MTNGQQGSAQEQVASATTGAPEKSTTKKFVPLNPPKGYQWGPKWQQHNFGKVPSLSKPPSYLHTPFVPDEEAGQQMHNWSKLRPWEQKVMSKLPGVVKKFQDSALGKFVGESLVSADKEFNETFLGKILYALDIPFEALERTSGLIAQQNWMANQGIDWDEGLSAAERHEMTKDMFVAGQFLSDFTNLPERKYVDGKFAGFQMDSDLPGLKGVVEARKLITQLRLSGMDRKDAVEEVRKAIYEEHGALSFRMQLQDLGARIFLDPLNYILPMIKPVRRLQTAAAKTLMSKFPREGLENLLKASRKAGQFTDRFWTFKKAIEAAEESGKIMGTFDKLAIYLTGGLENHITLLDEIGEVTPELLDIYRKSEGAWWSGNAMQQIANSKIPLARGVAKQLTLTPESLAHEMLSVFRRQFDNHVAGIGTAEMLEQYMRQIAGDMFSAKYGHGIMSIEGQVLTSAIKKSLDDVVLPSVGAYKTVRNEAELMQGLARLFNDPKITPQQLIDDIFTDGLKPTIKRLKKAGMSDAQEVALRNSMDTLEKIRDSWSAKKWVDFLPVSTEHLKHTVKMGVMSVVEDAAVEAFGVQSQGLVRKMAEAMKAGETLAFLRLNPGYPVRNHINNTFTLLGRQLNPWIRQSKIDDLVKKLGDMPYRMGEGYGMSGETLGKGAVSGRYFPGQKIAQQLRGKQTPLDDIRKTVNDLNIKFDMGELSRRFERRASERAFYGGYMQGMRMFWQPGVGFTSLRKGLPADVLAKMSDEQIEALENVVKSYGNTHTLDLADIADADDSLVAFSKLKGEVEATTGFKFEDVFEDDFIDTLQDGLQEAFRDARANNDPFKLSEYFNDVRLKNQQNLNDLTASRSELRRAYAKHLVDGERHAALSTMAADTIDDWIYVQVGHQMRMMGVNPLELPQKARRVYWSKIFGEEATAWKRHYGRVKDDVMGMMTSLAENSSMKVDTKLLDDLLTDYSTVWDDFYDFRSSKYAELFDALDNKKKTSLTFEGIQKSLKSRYDEIAKKEIEILKDLDDQLVIILAQKDKGVAKTFANWRKAARKDRLAMRKKTQEFLEKIQKVDDIVERHQLWKQFQADSVANMQKIHQTQRRGLVALYGDKMSAKGLADLTAYDEAMARAVANKFKFPMAAPERATKKVAVKAFPNAPQEAIDAIASLQPISKTADEFGSDIDEIRDIAFLMPDGRFVAHEGGALGIAEDYAFGGTRYDEYGFMFHEHTDALETNQALGRLEFSVDNSITEEQVEALAKLSQKTGLPIDVTYSTPAETRGITDIDELRTLAIPAEKQTGNLSYLTGGMVPQDQHLVNTVNKYLAYGYEQEFGPAARKHLESMGVDPDALIEEVKLGMKPVVTEDTGKALDAIVLNDTRGLPWTAREIEAEVDDLTSFALIEGDAEDLPKMRQEALTDWIMGEHGEDEGLAVAWKMWHEIDEGYEDVFWHFVGEYPETAKKYLGEAVVDTTERLKIQRATQLADLNDPEVIAEALIHRALTKGEDIPEGVLTARSRLHLDDARASGELLPSDLEHYMRLSDYSVQPKYGGKEVFYYGTAPGDDWLHLDIVQGNHFDMVDRETGMFIQGGLVRDPSELAGDEAVNIMKVELYTGQSRVPKSARQNYVGLDDFLNRVASTRDEVMVSGNQIRWVDQDTGEILVNAKVADYTPPSRQLKIKTSTGDIATQTSAPSSNRIIVQWDDMDNLDSVAARQLLEDLHKRADYAAVNVYMDTGAEHLYDMQQIFPDYVAGGSDYLIRPALDYIDEAPANEMHSKLIADLIADKRWSHQHGAVFSLNTDADEPLIPVLRALEEKLDEHGLSFYAYAEKLDIKHMDMGTNQVTVRPNVIKLADGEQEYAIEVVLRVPHQVVPSQDKLARSYTSLAKRAIRQRGGEGVGGYVIDPSIGEFVIYPIATDPTDDLIALNKWNVTDYYPVMTDANGRKVSSLDVYQKARADILAGKPLDEAVAPLPEGMRNKLLREIDSQMQRWFPKQKEVGVDMSVLFGEGDPDVPMRPDVRRLLNTGGPPIDEIKDSAYSMNGAMMIDKMQEGAMRDFDTPLLQMNNLNKADNVKLNKYLERVRGEFKDASGSARKFAEIRRDFALLNYRHRHGYDNTMSLFAPYAFWMTHSMQKWALSSLDRPAMLTTYMRLRKSLETMGAPKEGFPSRLNRSIKLPLFDPPSWLGDKYFSNPMGLMLPFDQMLYPWEQREKRQNMDIRRAEESLREMVESGIVTPEQAAEAMETQAGQYWDRAIAMSEASPDRDDDFDIANIFASFHAPLTWGYKAITGQKEDIGPLTPMGRNIKKFYGLLGINPVVEKEGFGSMYWTVNSSIREQLGLHPFDKWEDYRIDRALSNMVAESELSAHEAMRIMLERDPNNEHFLEAGRRAGEQYARGSLRTGSLGEKASSVAAFLLNVAGLPVYTYPEGEERQRQLAEDFGRAYASYEDGDLYALREFFDNNPEYETRLALWKSPSERMNRFLIDEIWSIWNQMPSLHKQNVSDALGYRFQQGFLDKETRNYAAFSPDELAVYLKSMGGDPPGTLGDKAIEIELAPLEIAHQTQAFYDIRRNMFPNYRKLQNVYFDLEEGAVRKAFLANNTELGTYWAWRDDYFHRNPGISPYVNDDYELQYKSPEAREAAYQRQPTMSRYEWQWAVGYTYVEMATRVYNGEYIPEDIIEALQQKAMQMGMNYDQFLVDIATSK